MKGDEMQEVGKLEVLHNVEQHLQSGDCHDVLKRSRHVRSACDLWEDDAESVLVRSNKHPAFAAVLLKIASEH